MQVYVGAGKESLEFGKGAQKCSPGRQHRCWTKIRKVEDGAQIWALKETGF